MNVSKIASAVLLLAAAFALTAQETVPRIDESIEVSIGNVDVVVTDQKGNRIRGLTREDFQLLEDDVPQVITNFAEYTAETESGTMSVEAAPTSNAPASPAAARQPRTIVIFAESLILAPFHSKPFFDRLRETVQRVVRPGDAVAIVTWADAVIVRQDFTDDVSMLVATLDKIEKESTGVPRNPAQSLRQREELAQQFEGSLAVESFKHMDERTKMHWDALERAQFQLFKIRQKTFALTALMQRMSAYEGKKIVLMSTQHFGDHAGVEYFGGIVPGEYRALLDTKRYRDALISTANAYGITIYPLYVPGLTTTNWSAPEFNPGIAPPKRDADMKRLGYDHNFLLNELHSLEEIARETGGMMQWSSKEVVSLLPKIAEDLESYYSLGWRINGRRTKNQKIVVRTKNPEYVVRSRREYAVRSDDARMQDRVVANLFQTVPGSLIPVEAKLASLKKTGKNRWSAMLHVRIPIKALTVVETDKGPGGEFSVYVAPGAVFGLATDVQRRSQKFTIDEKQLERARGSHFTYEMEVKLDHLVDRIGVGVFDETSKEWGLITVPVPPRKKDVQSAAERARNNGRPAPGTFTEPRPRRDQ